MGVATAAGAEANAVAPGSVINEDFWSIVQKNEWLEWHFTLFFLILFTIDFLEGIVRNKQVFYLPAKVFCLAHDIKTT